MLSGLVRHPGHAVSAYPRAVLRTLKTRGDRRAMIVACPPLVHSPQAAPPLLWLASAFPVAIPVGSVLASLAAGSPVLVKPAPQAPRCGQVAMAAIQRGLDQAGAPGGILTVVLSPEGDVGRRLVTHPEVARVILTGSIETAQLVAGWRADLDASEGSRRRTWKGTRRARGELR